MEKADLKSFLSQGVILAILGARIKIPRPLFKTPKKPPQEAKSNLKKWFLAILHFSTYFFSIQLRTWHNPLIACLSRLQKVDYIAKQL